MNKILLGILIPYYKNSEQCEEEFKKLMESLSKQLKDGMMLYVYEDGQFSNWLWEYAQADPKHINIESNAKNKGVSYARNHLINKMINNVEYILFIDSDDRVDDDYLKVMFEYCADKTHEIIESKFEDIYKTRFERDKVRSGAAGSAIMTKVIGDIRFDENLQIGEDTKFMNDVCDLTKYRKKLANTTYYYQLGANPNSLIVKWKRKEIGEKRENGKRDSKDATKV